MTGEVTDADPAALEGSTIAGKYLLGTLLGRGGMGAVYEARHTVTRKRCAIKVLLAHFEKRSELVERFSREVRASSIIESDHIVQVYDSGVDPVRGWPYMVMELLEGRDLERAFAGTGALAPATAGKVMLQAATGLARAHEMGIVHRDVKPANLFLARRDTGDVLVKVLDFGIAKIKMDGLQDSSVKLTRTGNTLGTPLYMAPEQARGAVHSDARSDVWSLGVVLFEALTGTLPYSDVSSFATVMACILTERLPRVQDRAPWTPPELAAITERAMSRDLAQRYQNAGELRDALARLLGEGAHVRADALVSISDRDRGTLAPRLHVDSVTEPAVGAARAPAGRLRAAAIAAAALAVGAGGVAGATWMLGRRSPAAGGAAATATASPTSSPAIATAAASGGGAAAAGPGTAAAAAVVRKRFRLRVAPAGAMILVDGREATLDGDGLLLEGPLGATRTVTLRRDGQEQEHVVVFAEHGMVPDRLTFVERPAGPPASGKRARAAGLARSREAGAPASGTASASASAPPTSPASPETQAATQSSKRSAGLSNSVDEFK